MKFTYRKVYFYCLYVLYQTYLYGLGIGLKLYVVNALNLYRT